MKPIPKCLFKLELPTPKEHLEWGIEDESDIESYACILALQKALESKFKGCYRLSWSVMALRYFEKHGFKAP